jgi:hypothetical protein
MLGRTMSITKGRLDNGPPEGWRATTLPPSIAVAGDGSPFDEVCQLGRPVVGDPLDAHVEGGHFRGSGASDGHSGDGPRILLAALWETRRLRASRRE